MINTFRWTEHNGVSLIAEVFIETGTFRGDSLGLAANHNFLELHSCDVVPDYVRAAQIKFAHDPRIHIHLGSSTTILPTIIDSLRSTTFWLDAHWQGQTRKEQDGDIECPLLDELKIIFGFHWKSLPIIIIDDSSMFIKHAQPGFNMAKWPTLEMIREVVLKDYVFDECDSALWFMPEK